jgi:predicted nuclease of predicted toxin-antitoxin system
MKLIVDMNLSPQWVRLLVDSGIPSEHWSTIGAANTPDCEIMAYASANGFVVLTHDLDFGAILAATHGEKPSVVQIRADDVSLGAIGNQVVLALLQMAPELEEGALVTVDPKRTRLRLLPLPLRGGKNIP